MRHTHISDFILLNTHRSGTRLLLGSLGRYSQIKCYKNAFDLTIILERFAFDRPKSLFYRFQTTSFKRRLDYIFHQKQLINDFLTELYTPANGVKAIGLRLLYEQADKHPEILDWAVENEVAIIHLIRENPLKAVVYTEASLKRGLLHSTSRAEPVLKLRLSPARFKMQLTRLTQQIEKYRATLVNARYLEVSYEELASRQKDETQRVLDFLKINPDAPLTIEPGERKLNLLPDSLEDILENYEEIKRALRGTAFERFLS
jgi:hypothetical protein